MRFQAYLVPFVIMIACIFGPNRFFIASILSPYTENYCNPIWSNPITFTNLKLSGVYSSEALKKKQEKEKKKNEFYLKYGHRPIEYNFELPVRYSPPPTYSAAS